jgi:prepilin-type N-terminal cleavage/methylation domain-containing protein
LRRTEVEARRCGAASRRARAGFTLLELLLALLAITVVAALAIPAWFERHEVSLENAAQMLARDLRSTQNQAAWSNTPQAVVFPPDGSGWRIVRWDPLVPAPIEEAEAVLVRDLGADAVFEGVRVDDVELGATRAARYDHQGQSLDQGWITLAFDGGYRTLALERGSGRLRMLDSTSHWVDPGL